MKKARRLVDAYGWPSRIYCSPFLRTKSTVEAMGRILREMRNDRKSKYYGYPKPELRYDRRLSRHFSRDEQDNPSMFPQTEKHQVPVVEDRVQFKKRVKGHVERMKQRGYYKCKKVVWCVTHAIVYKEVARLRGIETPRRIDFLRSFRA